MQSTRRSWTTSTMASVLPIVCLITMLAALAILQLRWSAKVSEAERARLQQNLQRSTSGFQSAFAQDLLGICQTLQASQPRDPAVLAEHLLDRYSVWRRVSGHAALIGALYIWPQSGGKQNVLLQLNPQTHTLEPVAWPDSLRLFANQSDSSIHALPHRPKFWRWNEQVPGLIHPLYVSSSHGSANRPQFFGYLFVVFNTQDFQQAYLPEIGRRYFPLSNGFAFQLVQLVQPDSDRGRSVVYQSDNHPSAHVFTHPDATIPLLESSVIYHSGAGAASSATTAAQAPSRVLLSAANSPQWQIVVRHRSGSVDAAVTSLRRRNLAVSVVLLFMLLVSLTTILIATRRARRLAQLQMEFASGVSHELRTPLAVIRSAAENLADGVVIESDRVRDYGALIHKESQRLSGMVDHILNFANLYAGTPSYRFETVVVTNIIERVMASERPLIESAGIALEMEIARDLPRLSTDAEALSQCLQNLLSNALKYGSDGRKILVAASPSCQDGEDRVLISVQDFGPGIAPEEISHIYEPFYRGSVARDSQIHGTGLGLSVTRGMMEALGGRITVESTPGHGSRFVLHVPIATAS